METNTLKFENTEKALNLFLEEFIKNYKELLIRDDKKASGNLIKSIKQLELEFRNNQIIGSISLAHYWKYVEYGRKAGGKFPPMNKILDWIKIKPVLPRPINGIKPTEKQLAFLISRKIARDGIKAGNQFDEALNHIWKKYEKTISDAVSEDLQKNINLF